MLDIGAVEAREQPVHIVTGPGLAVDIELDGLEDALVYKQAEATRWPKSCTAYSVLASHRPPRRWYVTKEL